jgi:hypothetical protein
MNRGQREYVKWLEKEIKKEKNALQALSQIAASIWNENFSNASQGIDYLESLVIAAYSRSPDTARDYVYMMTNFVSKCRDEIEKNPDSLLGSPRALTYNLVTTIIGIFEDSISWVMEEKTALQRYVREPHIVESNSKDRGTDGKMRKRVLGVLRSFPRISITDLSKYSGLSLDASRDLLFEMLGDNLISGRFDAAADEFISAPAATASRVIKSNSLSLARCQFCGKSLAKVPISGEEVTCSSCGMLNVG